MSMEGHTQKRNKQNLVIRLVVVALALVVVVVVVAVVVVVVTAAAAVVVLLFAAEERNIPLYCIARFSLHCDFRITRLHNAISIQHLLDLFEVHKTTVPCSFRTSSMYRKPLYFIDCSKLSDGELFLTNQSPGLPWNISCIPRKHSLKPLYLLKSMTGRKLLPHSLPT